MFELTFGERTDDESTAENESRIQNTATEYKPERVG